MADAITPRYEALVLTAAGLGIRRGEAFGLAVEDIDFLRGIVHVRRQVKVFGGPKLVFAPPQGGRLRDVPLAESVALRLSAHLAAYPAVEADLPWTTPDGPPHSEP
ncbi:hypothetical protein AB0O28_16765 [Microbispora sp. NPDC088329]|uniref:hypothetical protein n=1 Tax=Microbispora sp. NPDC088329 TaxID=3154869 RepID=UPI00341A4D3E